jgi:hypothetical protein
VTTIRIVLNTGLSHVMPITEETKALIARLKEGQNGVFQFKQLVAKGDYIHISIPLHAISQTTEMP